MYTRSSCTLPMDHAKLVINNVCKLLYGELLELLEGEVEKEKRIWVREWLKRRNEHGASSSLLTELYVEDHIEYRSCLRMSPKFFDKLLDAVGPEIQKLDTLMRDALPARMKLEITLSYLATGNTFRNLQHQFCVSIAAISKLIPEVCDAIYYKLHAFIKLAESEEEWRSIEQGFRDKWNFPNCYGALDGKYIEIRAPPNCGSTYYNYKKTNGIIFMALVDDDYCFRYIDVGSNGSVSDGGVFNRCFLFSKLHDNMLPKGGFIVGDDAFPLKTYLMKPYSGTNLSYEEKVFNYRLSRARRIVENAFGILVSRFRIFEKRIACKVDSADKVVRAACTLHNWLRRNAGREYLPHGCVDIDNTTTGESIPGTWRLDTIGLPSVTRVGSNHHSRDAKATRDAYKQYLVNEGKVSWQDRMVH